MQKIEDNGSILIWTIFLSIIITIAFLGVSTKIHSHIKNSGNLLEQSDTTQAVQNYIKTSELSQTYDDTIIAGIHVDFEDRYNLSRSLKKNTHTQYKIKDLSSIRVAIISGGPLYYEIRATEGISTSSGIIISSKSIVESITGTGSLMLKNLGGNTNFSVESDTPIIPPRLQYSLKRQVGNIVHTQSSGEIHIFIPGDF